MYKFPIARLAALLGLCLGMTACIPKVAQRTENKAVPAAYYSNRDTANVAMLPWRSFFTDPVLVDLIDTALKNNQELNSTLQEIEIARSEVRARKGAILPTVGARVGSGLTKVGRYTSEGAGDASTEILPGREVPDPIADYGFGLVANWEVDVWKKLRTAKKAAYERYLASIEGRNFVLTNLIAEVANSYYELRSLDYQLEIVQQNIALQQNALGIVKVQKEAARTTELAVQKFQAEVLKSQTMEYDIRQQIREAENKINFLLARYPQEIPRSHSDFLTLVPAAVSSGIPSQLLANRPDIRQAELNLAAARLDVAVARKEFYPSFDITATLGFGAFNPSYLVRLPESIVFSLLGDVAGPLINRNAIKAEYYAANARQLQSVYNYERTILNAYLEVNNQLSKIDNLDKSYTLKSQQVAALNRSIDVSNDLFKSARADYFEVLMTQRDALEAKLELVETRKEQLGAVVDIYKELGGGWQ